VFDDPQAAGLASSASAFALHSVRGYCLVVDEVRVSSWWRNDEAGLKHESRLDKVVVKYLQKRRELLVTAVSGSGARLCNS
jgi:hypothetical protein